MTALPYQRPEMSKCKSRGGFTLIELSVSLVSSVLLMAGLTSAIYISSQTLDMDSSTSRQSVIASEVLGDMTADLALARSFSERTATAVTFEVPDRDGDLHPETIRYAWSGTPGDPLTYQYNGGTAITIATDVQSLELAAFTRSIVAPAVAATLPEVVYVEFTETKQPSNLTSIAIDLPPGTSAGDLLITALALDGPHSGIVAPAGWNVIDMGTYQNQVYFGVWWKIATAAEGGSYTFTWDTANRAYGWIMRFTGHDPTSPIHQLAVGGGDSKTPTTPAVTTTIGYTMILRLGCFEGHDITVDDTGLSGHTTITMDASASGGNISGGAAYVLQPTAGDSGTADFKLTNKRRYRTVTVAIAPDPY